MNNIEKKNEVRFFNLRINAHDASFENLNIGPNLSPFMKRDKINQFCTEFNNITSLYLYKDIPIYIKLYLYTDNSFFFIIKGPSIAFLLKIIFNIESLSDNYLFKNSLTFNEFYDIIILKRYFINKYIKKDSFILKRQARNILFGIKNLYIANRDE
jgi:ribosomal protein L11